MIVADTTVAVAAALRWHEDHQLAARALAGRRTRLIAHVGLETYSVLTRLPPMHRVTPASAYEFIAGTFAATPVVLTPAGYDELLVIAVREQMIGGAVYDALIGATAKQLEATLLTFDRRAITTYEAVGASYELLH